MQSFPLYDLARLREDEIRRAASTAYWRFTPSAGDVTDVPRQHRRWRVRWHRHPRPVTA